jgi:protein-S-isoprenylcysteine O-methyltransferase Ste14
MTPLTVDLHKRSVQNWLFLTPLLLLILFRLALGMGGRAHHGLPHGALANPLVDGAGLTLVVVGLSLRVLARGWKAENSRGRLVTSGLYAYIRHPLYLASFLIGLGLCLIMGDGVVLAVYLLLFVAMHAWVIHGEEQWMAAHWGEEYRRYSARVPRFLPRPGGRARRERVRPGNLTRAIALEADAICAWLSLAFLLLGWESLANGPNPAAVVPLALAACCLLLWPSLKRAARKRRAP